MFMCDCGNALCVCGGGVGCLCTSKSQLPVAGVTGDWGNLPQISRLALGSLLSKIMVLL